MYVCESLTVNIWKITPVMAGVEGAGVITTSKVYLSDALRKNIF